VGAHSITVSSAEHRPATIFLDEHLFGGETDIRVEIVLGACKRTLSGTVVDTHGRPIARARVGHGRRPPTGYAILGSVETDDLGRFSICEPDDSLAVHAEGYGVTMMISTSFRHGMTVVLCDGGSVEGAVQTAQGRPVSGARVMLDLPDPELLAVPFHAITTDETGKFRFADITPGVYELRVYHPRHGYHTERVRVRPRQTATVNVELPGCDASITGVVRDEDGDAVPHAELEFAHARTFTDELGTFEAFCVVPGRIEVPGHDLVSPERCDEDCVAHGSLEIVVRRRREVEGIVTIDAQPAPGALVAWRDRSLNGVLRPHLSRTTTDGNGRYSLRVPHTDVELLAFSAGNDRTSGIVALDDGGDPLIVNFELANRYVITGKVLRVDGEPVARRSISLDTEPGVFLPTRMTVTDDDGAFVFEGVSWGAHRLSVSRPAVVSGGGDASFDVMVPQQEPAILLVEGGRFLLSGRVAASDGTPAPARVILNPGRVFAIADAAGRFSFAGLEARTYQVSASTVDGALGTATVRLEGDTSDVLVTVRSD
jgi:hypothetical protein